MSAGNREDAVVVPFQTDWVFVAQVASPVIAFALFVMAIALRN